jgi:hypothetical protein
MEGGHVAANGTVENLPSWLAANAPTLTTLCVRRCVVRMAAVVRAGVRRPVH